MLFGLWGVACGKRFVGSGLHGPTGVGQSFSVGVSECSAGLGQTRRLKLGCHNTQCRAAAGAKGAVPADVHIAIVF